MQFAILDIALLIIVLLSAVLAMVRGFSREILSVGSWIAAAGAALFVAFWKDNPLTDIVKPYVESELIAMIVTVSIVFLVVLIIVSIITMKISDFIIDSSIGALDRTLGFIFGAARGLLLFVVAIGMFNWLAHEAQPDWITNAKSKPFLDDMAVALTELLPQDLEEFVEIGKGFISGDDEDQPSLDEKPGADISSEGRNQLNRVIEDGTNN